MVGERGLENWRGEAPLTWRQTPGTAGMNSAHLWGKKKTWEFVRSKQMTHCDFDTFKRAAIFTFSF